MNTNICTSIKQSKKLIELGLDANTADMCWGINSSTRSYNNIPYLIPWKDYTCKEYYVPAWSLSALLELMPKYITEDNSSHIIRITPTFDNRIEMCYWDKTSGHILSNYIRENTFIDAAFEMVCWLLENKKL